MDLARALLVASALSCAAVLPVHADTLNVKSIDQAPPNTPAGILRPTRGMTMDQVTRKFGKPLKVLPAVGDPPITRWVYNKFIVYFERQYVIHAVVPPK